jgi:uncharacterized protein
MNIFIDTSAFLAVLNANDRFHQPARNAWSDIITSGSGIFTSNYIILETTALLQHRFGIEALRLFDSELMPVVEIAWVDEAIHKQGMSTLLAANRRDLSLVDCTSFEIMRHRDMDRAFTFDPHFGEQGFAVIPK